MGMFDSIGAIAGAGLGGVAGIPGMLLGAGAGSQVFGGPGLSQMLGVQNNFQGMNPIDAAAYNNLIKQLQQQQGGIFQNQNDLASALLSQSLGQGPNPAQIALNQATNQNIKQAAGLIASQKGINPGLAARQIADQTANANQVAAGQGAMMQAQQQLAAQNQLQNLYGTMGQQNVSQQQMLNSALLGGSLGSQQLNAQASAGNAQTNAGLIGGLLGAGGTVAAMGMRGGAMAASQGARVPGNRLSLVPALLSSGERYLDPEEAQDVASGKVSATRAGKKVPGRPVVDGDSPLNDRVPSLLEGRGVVIPRSKADDEEAAKAFVDHLFKRKNQRGKGESDSRSLGRALAGA